VSFLRDKPAVTTLPAGQLSGRRWKRAAGFVEPALVVVGFLVLFEVIARSGVLGGYDVLPAPTQIAPAFWRDLTQGDILWQVWITLSSCLIAVVVVFAVTIPVGMLLGLSTVAYRSVRLFMEGLRTIPAIAALPFLVLLYGIGTELTIVLVALTCIWPLLFSAISGVHEVDPVALQTAQVYGLNGRQRFMRIVLPSSLPYIVTGLRISVTFGLVVAIGVSLYAGGQGLGYAIMQAYTEQHVSLMFARVFLAGLLGLVVYYFLISIEKRLLFWHPTYRKAT
jgi:NitT/TauT family transport system permease protein